MCFRTRVPTTTDTTPLVRLVIARHIVILGAIMVSGSLAKPLRRRATAAVIAVGGDAISSAIPIGVGVPLLWTVRRDMTRLVTMVAFARVGAARRRSRRYLRCRSCGIVLVLSRRLESDRRGSPEHTSAHSRCPPLLGLSNLELISKSTQ